tara:strand:+ start:622 stop:996 length:375 start_codon:yes stop_codon:yes gene_type:complete
MKFEPPNTPMAQRAPSDPEHMMRLEHDYTDDELLIELRRRGRIARVEAHDVVPGRYRDDVSHQMQFKTGMMKAIDEMIRQLGTHRAIPGSKIENVEERHAVPGSPPGRRMRLPLNVIVNKEPVK